MKKILAVAILLPLLIMSISACRKSNNITAHRVNVIPVPATVDSLMGSTVLFSSYVFIGNISGLLSNNKITGTLTDTGGYILNYERKWYQAAFVNELDKYCYAGYVSVNANSMVYYTNSQDYRQRNNDANTGVNHWIVNGADSTPPLSADVPAFLPEFTGNLPTTIDTTHDFVFTFNEHNTTYTDSAYVIIYTAVSPGIVMSSMPVSAHGGTVIIPASDLRKARNNYLHTGRLIHYPATDCFYGGYIVVGLFSHATTTSGGKNFAFINQRQVLGLVKFIQ